MFDSARQALRSALELQAEGAGLPLGIGVGLDAGEAIPVGEGYRGGALNLAARLCSLAGPGEVLATETVLQLARAVDGVKYGERRVERVKGFAQPVTAVEILPADRRTKRWTVPRLKRAARRAPGGGACGSWQPRPLPEESRRLSVLGFAGSAGAAPQIEQKSLGLVSPSGQGRGAGAARWRRRGASRRGIPLVRELGRQVRRAHRPAHAQASSARSCRSRTGWPAWRSGSAASGSSTAISLSPPSDRPAST